MNTAWRHQAQHLNQLIDAGNENQARIYLEQLLLFPPNIQNRIIEDISKLSHCNSQSIASIMHHYSVLPPSKHN